MWGGEQGRDEVWYGRGALTCPPVSSIWVEEVRVESIRFGEPLQMASNMVNLIERQSHHYDKGATIMTKV